MANNFRVTTATKYVSKSGHDSNDGLTADKPKKTISSTSVNGTNVAIGSGVYENVSCPTNTTHGLRGDGKVIITNLSHSGGVQQCVNVTIIGGSIGLRQTTASFCTFKNMTVGAAIATSALSNCICINSVLAQNRASGIATAINNCVLINCTAAISSFAVLSQLNSSYVDFDCEIGFSGTAANFRNNNINGLILLDTTGGIKSYAIQDQLVGTPQDNGYAVGVNWLTEAQLTADGYTGTVSGWNTAVSTCMNRDPRFNDVSGEDFTLQSDSPHIRAAVGGIGNIGGTVIARSVLNTDDNGSTVFVTPSAEIDTTIPTSYILDVAETEGTIDYIVDLGSVVPIANIDLKAELSFNSDIAGGSVGNENVPDSEPLTADYANKTTTTASASPALNQLIVATGLITLGDYVRVAGEVREVTVVTPGSPNDTITVASNFRAAVGNGVTVTYGTQLQLAALNPNRLSYLLRVSTQATKPVIDSEWDNDLDPAYGEEGTFFQQEWNQRPIYAISGGVVYGGGAADRPLGAATQEINARWLHVRVYLRDNYSSDGL